MVLYRFSITCRGSEFFLACKTMETNRKLQMEKTSRTIIFPVIS